MPARDNRSVANGAVRPSPTIRRTNTRRDTRPAFTAPISSRSSRSSIEVSLCPVRLSLLCGRMLRSDARRSGLAVPVLQIPQIVVPAADAGPELARGRRPPGPVEQLHARLLAAPHVVAREAECRALARI